MQSLLYFAQPGKVNKKTHALPTASGDTSQIQTALALMIGIAAAVAVLVIVIAAINFATAGSDTEKLARSKKTIVYALIGLAIALLGEMIVFFVLSS